jgi:hypothetical protein
MDYDALLTEVLALLPHETGAQGADPAKFEAE